MHGWENLLNAQIGASAALTGLIFVSVSLNLAKILQYPGLPWNAAEALIALASVLFIATLLLLPGQSLQANGLEVLGIGLLIWGIETIYHIDLIRKAERRYVVRVLPAFGLSQLSTLSFIIGGIVILRAGASGFYWLAPGILFSYALALLNAWVLLIEINR